MSRHARSFRFVPLSLLLLAGGVPAASAAEPAPAAAGPANSSGPTPVNPTGEVQLSELIRSYLSLRDQLHALQLSMLQQRLDTEVAARTQTTLVTEKLEAIRTSLEAERESRRQESQRAQAERERLTLELAGIQRTVLGMAAGLVILGLAAAGIRYYRTAGRRPRPATTAEPEQPVPVPPVAAAAPSPGAAPAVAPSADVVKASPPPAPPTPAATEPNAPTPRPAARFPDRDPLEQMRRDPMWIAGLLSQGNSLLMDNRAREALSCFEELLQFDPSNGEAWVKRGLALERLQQFESALRSYDQAIALEPSLSAAHLHRAGLCTRLRRFDEAADSYRRAASGNAPIGAMNR